MGRAPRRHCGGQHAGDGRHRHGQGNQCRVDGDVEQAGAEGVEHLHQRPADQPAEAGAGHAEQAALEQEHPQDLSARAAHGAQDADLAGALDHADRQHAGDAEGHRQADEQADHLRGHGLRAQRVEQLAVGGHPAFRLQAGEARQAGGDGFGLEDVAHRGVDHRHPAGQVEQGLGLLEVEVDVARIQLAHAQLEDAGDIDDRLAALAGVQAQLVTDAEAQVVGQLLADHRVPGADREVPGDQVLGDRDDALVAHGVDAHQRHRGTRHTAAGDGRAADQRRHGEQLRLAVEGVAHVLPVADRAQALGARVFQDQRQRAVGRRQHAVDLVQWQDADVRLGAEGALDDVGLQAGDQRGDEDDHRRTDADADDDQ
ncbi:hypothetical protein D3C80_775040 [compost metagenome]